MTLRLCSFQLLGYYLHMPGAVNPYTFVPLGKPSERGRPGGHDRLDGGRLSGAFDVSISTQSPLLLGPLNDDEAGPPRSMTDDARVMIPGSGIAGAVRGLHETLTNSCLRIVDLGYRPVHRHTITKDLTRNLRMAVVTGVQDGLPTHVTLCTRVVWIHHAELQQQASATPWQTGDRIKIPEVRIDDREQAYRDVVRALPTVPPPPHSQRLTRDNDRGPWVLLITDTKARPGSDAWFAAGLRGDQELTVTDDARVDLARAIEGSDDLINRTRSGVQGGYIDVPWPKAQDDPPTPGGPSVGRRWLVTGNVPRGLPVWVEVKGGAVSGGEVTSVRLSQAWRFPGRHPVAQRLSADGSQDPWTPCTTPDRLCPSCRLLGSAGADDNDSNQLGTSQDSYAGHVRFHDALATEDVQLKTVSRAPLSSPRPSAGQFYLDNSALGQRPAADLPLANWGPPGDKNPDAPRRIRGRKFYWATVPESPGGIPTGPHRGIARGHQSPAFVDEVHLTPAGTTFSTRITFDGISREQLASLLASLEPRYLWPDEDDAARDRIVTRLGGGKPFGWGAVTMHVSNLTTYDAAARYLDKPIASESLADSDVIDLVAEFARGCDANNLAALRNVLTLNYVADRDVWYPPGTGRPGDRSYDEGFEFWQNSAGLQYQRQRRPLTSLPEATVAAAQQLVSAEEVPGEAREGAG